MRSRAARDLLTGDALSQLASPSGITAAAFACGSFRSGQTAAAGLMHDARLLYQLALHRYSDIGLGSVPTMPTICRVRR